MPDDFESFLQSTAPQPATPGGAPALPQQGPATAPTQAADPFENFLTQQKSQQDAATMQQAQATAVANSSTSADAAGKAAGIAKQIGAPQAAVETDIPRYEAQAKAQTNAQTLAADPKLANWVAANPDSARIAQDDFSDMSQINKIVSDQLWGAAKPILTGLAQGAASSFNSAALGVNRLIGLGAKGVDAVTGTDASDWWFNHMVQPALTNRDALATPADAPFGVKAASTVGNLLGTLVQIAATGGAGELAQGADAATSVAGAVGQTVAHGARSMAFPSLTAAVNTGKDVYDQTGDMQQAIRASQMSYVTTTAGGVVPLGAAGGLGTRLATGAISGIATGEVSRQAMNLVMPQQQGFDPEETILSGLSGAMLGGAMGPRALHDGVRQAYADGLSAETAERGGAALTQLSEMAAASKLRQHDPEAFHSYVEQMSEDSPLANVYVDGKTFADALHQSSVDPTNIPGLNDRVQEAVNTGGDVQIPIADYATHIAGTDLDKTILPNLKSEEGGMTFSEGQQFYQNAAEDMTARAKDIVAQQDSTDAQQDDVKGIGDKLFEQMQATGRFPDDVARTSVTPVAEFYRTMAERTGQTPGELFEQNPLQIKGEAIAGSLDQAGRDKFAPEDSARGAFDPDTHTIALLNGADLSTMLHESGHFFLSTLGDLAGREDAPQQIKDDMQTAITWMGGKDLADWQGKTLEQQRDMHEKFARGFETYLMEGKAPSQAMQPLFARFRSWLVNVYRSVSGLGAELTPEVRGVFDRLLASDNAIRSAETARGYFPMDLSKTGATEKQLSDYATMGQQATQDAVSEMQTKSIKDMKWASNAKNKAIRDMQREADGARKTIREQVTKEVEAQPVEQARAFIKEMALDLNPDRKAYKESVEQHAAQRDEAARTSLEAWVAANPEPEITPKVAGEKPNAAERKEYNAERKVWTTARDEAATQRAADWKDQNPEPVKLTTPQTEWAAQRETQRATVADQVKDEYLGKPEAADLKGIKKGQYLAKVKREMANEVERRVLDWEKSNPKPADTTQRADPDMVAEQFGFGSGKELRAALDAETPADKIARMTDERMLQQHGELTDPAAVDAAANEAVHNEARARFMATGLKLLTKSPISARDLAKAAKEAADTAIAAKRVRDVNPRQYEVAEAKANKEALLQAPKDITAAVEAQRQALLSNRLAKSAQDAIAEIKKIVTGQARYDKSSIRAKMDPDILDQIDALRERFDFRQNPPDGPTKQQVQLQTWVDTQKAFGYAPMQHPDMLDPTVRMHYKDMTVEQLRGFNDTVRSMEQIARERKSIMVDGKKADLKEIVGDLVDKMKARPDQFTPEQLVDRPRSHVDSFLSVALDRMSAGLRAAAAEFKPQQFKANQFDQHEVLGPFSRAIFERVFGANYKKVDMLKSLAVEFSKGAEKLGKDWQNGLNDLVPNSKLIDADLTHEGGEPVYRRLTRGDMLGIARHVGNESNFDKLTKGMGWEPRDVWSFLSENMTDKDWQSTQMVWDAFEKHWPEMVEMNKRLGNTMPDRIEPRAFKAGDISLKGGYAPIDYDPIRSKLAVKKSDASAINPADGLFGKGYFRADTTTNGSLNSRVANYYDRLNLDYHSIERRLHDTIHDLAYREALLDVHKVLSDQDFRRQFQLSYGPEQYKSMQKWVGDLANGQNTDAQMSKLSAILQSSRHMMVANGIALRASTMIKHGGSALAKSTGYFSGGGGKYFAARVAQIATDHEGQVSSAIEKFPEIRARAMQQDRDYRATTASLFQPESFHSKAERFGHSGVAYLDLLSAVPTAWAAYDRAITEGIPKNRGGTGKPMSDQDAVAYASQLVREAHGSNIESARSMVMQQKSEAIKAMTTMYGFMNNSLGQALDMADKLKTSGFSKPEVLSRFLMATIVPALVAGALEKNKGDEGWAMWAGKAITGEVSGMVPLLRDVWSMMKGYPSAGLPAYMSVLASIGKPVNDVIKAVQGKEVKSPIKDAGNAIGLAIPGAGQIGTSLQYAADVHSGKQQPKNVVDVARGLALGQGNN